MSDLLLQNVLFHAFGLLYVIPVSLKDTVHLGAQADVFRDWAPGTFIRHLPDNLFVFNAVQRVLAWVVRRVIELGALGHVPIDVLRLDLKEKAVGV